MTGSKPFFVIPYSLLSIRYSLFHSHPFFLNRQYRNEQISAIAIRTVG